MQKYALLEARVRNELGVSVTIAEPPRASDEDVLRVHCPGYVERVRSGSMSEREQRKIGFPWSLAMAERTRRVSGATMMALRAAMEGDGVALNLAGGTHHAHYDFGAGYCVFNDSVIAARYVQSLALAERVLIIDLDVHQGDGTAAITSRDPSIFTFSMHAARNYPALKPASDFDLALENGVADEDYLGQLARALPIVLARAQANAAIYLAGADPFEHDRLGFLKLSKNALLERDRMVLAALKAAGIPCAISMAGGYADCIDDIVDIHFQTVSTALTFSNR
jgi:acetoin utilization deacetylase AcuC-like enzyme